MLVDRIKSVLETGECPECMALVISDEDMTTYFCPENRQHFELMVKFHGGERIEAMLNGTKVDDEAVQDLEW